MITARSPAKSLPLKENFITSWPPTTMRNQPLVIWPAVASSLAAQIDSLSILAGTWSRVRRNDSLSPDCAPRSWIDSSGDFGWLKKTK